MAQHWLSAYSGGLTTQGVNPELPPNVTVVSVTTRGIQQAASRA